MEKSPKTRKIIVFLESKFLFESNKSGNNFQDLYSFYQIMCSAYQDQLNVFLDIPLPCDYPVH